MQNSALGSSKKSESLDVVSIGTEKDVLVPAACLFGDFRMLSLYSQAHFFHVASFLDACFTGACWTLTLCPYCPPDYETIFRLLEEVRGPSEVQKYFIHQTIKEAAR